MAAAQLAGASQGGVVGGVSWTHAAASADPPLPAQIGPCQLSSFGEKWVAVRCPGEFEPLMGRAGGLWDPASRRWLIERRRIGPVFRALRRDTDPLFRQCRVS
jgi:hypothetical protein